VLRRLALAGLVVLVAAAAGADVIHFKDGTTKRVEIYHESPTYVCFVHDGKLAGAAKSTIEKIDYEDEPVCDVKKVIAEKAAQRKKKEKKKELSALDLLRKKYGKGEKEMTPEEKKRAERAKLLESKFRAGSKSGSSGAPPKPTSGTAYIPAGQSETGESEMIVDPFPGERNAPPRRR